MGNAAVKVIENPEDKQKLQKLFKKLDRDGNGRLDQNEWLIFGQLLWLCNVERVDEATKKALIDKLEQQAQAIGLGSAGKLLVKKFGSSTLQLLFEQIEYSTVDDYAKSLFHTADLDQNGFVDFAEFCIYLQNIAPTHRQQRAASLRNLAADQVENETLVVQKITRHGFTTDTTTGRVKLTGLTPPIY